jgi:hypothetical protein
MEVALVVPEGRVHLRLHGWDDRPAGVKRPRVEGHPDRFAAELLQDGDAVRGGQEAGGAIKAPVQNGSGPDPKFTTIRPAFGCWFPSGCPLVIAWAGPATTSKAARTPAVTRHRNPVAIILTRLMAIPLRGPDRGPGAAVSSNGCAPEKVRTGMPQLNHASSPCGPLAPCHRVPQLVQVPGRCKTRADGMEIASPLRVFSAPVRLAGYGRGLRSDLSHFSQTDRTAPDQGGRSGGTRDCEVLTRRPVA